MTAPEPTISTGSPGGETVRRHRVDLSNAKLMGADLTRADLTDADLTSADLTAATLSGATLRQVNLTRDGLFCVRGSGSSGAEASAPRIPVS